MPALGRSKKYAAPPASSCVACVAGVAFQASSCLAGVGGVSSCEASAGFEGSRVADVAGFEGVAGCSGAGLEGSSCVAGADVVGCSGGRCCGARSAGTSMSSRTMPGCSTRGPCPRSAACSLFDIPSSVFAWRRDSSSPIPRASSDLMMAFSPPSRSMSSASPSAVDDISLYCDVESERARFFCFAARCRMRASARCPLRSARRWGALPRSFAIDESAPRERRAAHVVLCPRWAA
mmetsp:Transcript_42366/g.100693  ORF Transcript_42366/g.100693 Transcript_42366/m.100693 type:complete len:235 (-) Transcript_42366:328-1032(-)